MRAFDFALVDINIPYDVGSKQLGEPRNQYGIDLHRWLSERVGIMALAMTGTTDPQVTRSIAGKIIKKPVRNFKEEVERLLRAAAAARAKSAR
jgi:hypothetical protein